MRSEDETALALGAAALLLLGSGGKRSSSSSVFVSQWPMPVLLVQPNRGADSGRTVRYAPSISDGIHLDGRPRYHPGADLMYRRPTRWTRAQQLVPMRWDQRHFASGPPNASPGGWYFCPPDVTVRPVHVGRLWHASMTAAGGQVIIDHGSYVSLYLHLSRLSVPLTASGLVTEAGPRRGLALPVGLATPLGAVGADPRQGSRAIRHLHLELITYVGTGRREGESRRVYHDPAPHLRDATEWVLDVTEGTSTLEP
jgi:hypothetical protein